jgi:hypothetical protein
MAFLVYTLLMALGLIGLLALGLRLLAPTAVRPVRNGFVVGGAVAVYFLGAALPFCWSALDPSTIGRMVLVAGTLAVPLSLMTRRQLARRAAGREPAVTRRQMTLRVTLLIALPAILNASLHGETVDRFATAPWLVLGLALGWLVWMCASLYQVVRLEAATGWPLVVALDPPDPLPWDAATRKIALGLAGLLAVTILWAAVSLVVGKLGRAGAAPRPRAAVETRPS